MIYSQKGDHYEIRKLIMTLGIITCFRMHQLIQSSGQFVSVSAYDFIPNLRMHDKRTVM